MDRREWLSYTAGSIAFLAGCSDVNNTDDSTGNQNESTSGADESEGSDSDEGTSDTEERASVEIIDLTAPSQVEAGRDFEVSVVINNPNETEVGQFVEIEIYNFQDERQDRELVGSRDLTPGKNRFRAEMRVEETGQHVVRVQEEDIETTVDAAAPAPKVIAAAPVSDWNSFGDLDENELDEVEGSELFEIAFRREQWSHDGAMETRAQVEINDSEGDRVYFDSMIGENLTDESGLLTYEWTFPRVELEDPGQYQAEVLVRDEIAGKTSDAYSFDFTVI